MLDSQAPASTQGNPIGAAAATLSAVYHDESPMDTATKAPSLTVDGADQPGAWGTSLTVTNDSSKNNDYRTTVSYTVPSSYDDGAMHTFTITFYDTDKSVGCGVATFYVQSPPTAPQPSTTCQEDVLDKNSPPTPSSSAANPVTSLPATLTVSYADESPINTSDNPPALAVDGVAKSGAQLNVADTSSGNNYSATVSYQVPDTYADGHPHTFVITVYDTDHSSGCGVGTFYLNVPKP